MPIEKLTRRRFGYSLCGATLLADIPARAAAADHAAYGPAVVAKVYLGAPTSHWPRTGMDLAKEAAEVDARLAEVERKHAKSVRFTGGKLLTAADQIPSWAAGVGGADALLVVPVCQPCVSIPAVQDAAKLPTLCFSRPFVGHQWSSIAGLRKAGRRIDVLASSSFGGLDDWIPVFRALHHLRTSKVMVITDNPSSRQTLTAEFTKQFGTQFAYLKYADLQPLFDRADAREAERAAAEFTRNALRVVEPSPREIAAGLRFYLAMQNLLRDEKANAITLDCFPALLAKKMPAYPCIAWSKLNDQGLYGVCEGDVRSTLTQLLVTSMTGMPGFVSDPVFDTSRNEVIHAHCVAATRMKGIDGPSSPYLVRSHLETAEGAVMQVLMPSGETITVAEFADPRKFLVSTAEVTGTTAEVTGSPDAEGGCRSKIRTRVADAQKWLENYSSGLHRVIFYGHHVAAIERAGHLGGFEVVKEM
jgi:hypothetical protein